MRTTGGLADERDKPREVGGPNGIADGHFGFRRILVMGDGKHKTRGKRCYGRR